MPSTVTSSRASSPMDDDSEGNPLYAAFTRLDYDLSANIDDPQFTRNGLRSFLTDTTPTFPQGIPHALGLHISDGPLSEALTAQAELIKALTAEVRGLAAIVHSRLPPPGVAPPTQPSAPPPKPAPAKAMPPPAPKPPTPPKVPAPKAQPPKPSAQRPSFSSVTKSPARPSLVISPSSIPPPGSAVRKTPLELCAHLNAVLAAQCPGASLSAARWTKNNNLVLVASPDTTAHHLQLASKTITMAIATFISMDPSRPVPLQSKDNVRWSRLTVNNIPTGVSPTRGAYSPSECQDALARDNPAYRTLRLTRLPSWVKRPDSYAAGSSSSLVLSFEDPTGDALQTLLAQKRLFAFGQAGDLRVWKQKPRAHASPPTS
ncbi:hypothetical protein EDB86DRAFT_3083363 [Lactarius hatsudake]|nr:hypothetical protein EDB86DRAFT_3083363 [Lactarius hatsudake]